VQTQSHSNASDSFKVEKLDCKVPRICAEFAEMVHRILSYFLAQNSDYPTYLLAL